MEKIDIIIATNNKDKVKEFKQIFNEDEFHVTSLKEEGIVSDPEETGTDFKTNAVIKAKAVAVNTNKIVISDDSGLCVHGLDEFPGIYSARFMEGHPYSEKCAEIIKRLEGNDNKGCAYHCAMALLNFEDEPVVFEGICEGKIVSPVFTDKGFGYDPMFFVEEKGCRFSEMSSEEKHAISHRGKATRMLIEYFEKNLDKYKERNSKK